MSDRPLIIDVSEFLKTKPLFCVKCENFTHTATEFCEHCGSRYSLRKAKAKDIKRYNKSKPITPPKPTLEVSKLEAQQHSLLQFSSDSEIQSFLSNQRFFCEYCKRFTVRNQGYCENCGTQHSLRRAKKNDIERYNEMRKKQQEEYQKIMQYKQDQPKIEKEPTRSIPEVSHLKLKELKPIPETTVRREVKTEEIPNVCPNCGHKIPDLKNRFCVSCGFQLKEVIQEIKQEEVVKEEVSEACPKCGHTIPDLKYRFCVNCGSQLKDILPEIEQEEVVKPLPIVKKEEKPKVVSMPQEQDIPLTPEVKQPKSYEEPVVKVPQVKAEELKPIPKVPEKKEEKPKPTHIICRFCGVKLELTEKFCYQCGTIVK